MTTYAVPAFPVAKTLTAHGGLDASDDLVEAWGLDSFPASDPPANW